MLKYIDDIRHPWFWGDKYVKNENYYIELEKIECLKNNEYARENNIYKLKIREIIREKNNK